MTNKPRNYSKRNLGLKLVWVSAIHQRERHDILWYETGTTRATARKKFEQETIGGKPKFIRIEEIMRPHGKRIRHSQPG